jgi:hypothetical protein
MANPSCEPCCGCGSSGSGGCTGRCTSCSGCRCSGSGSCCDLAC